MLPQNGTLQSLNLDNNALTDAFVEDLCNAIRGHPALTHLSLNGNNLSDESAKVLLLQTMHLWSPARKGEGEAFASQTAIHLLQ